MTLFCNETRQSESLRFQVSFNRIVFSRLRDEQSVRSQGKSLQVGEKGQGL
jgi:hypothetical protein